VTVITESMSSPATQTAPEGSSNLSLSTAELPKGKAAPPGPPKLSTRTKLAITVAFLAVITVLGLLSPSNGPVPPTTEFVLVYLGIATAAAVGAMAAVLNLTTGPGQLAMALGAMWLNLAAVFAVIAIVLSSDARAVALSSSVDGLGAGVVFLSYGFYRRVIYPLF